MPIELENGVILIESSDEEVPHFNEDSAYEYVDPSGGIIEEDSEEDPEEDLEEFTEGEVQSQLRSENDTLNKSIPNEDYVSLRDDAVRSVMDGDLKGKYAEVYDLPSENDALMKNIPKGEYGRKDDIEDEVLKKTPPKRKFPYEFPGALGKKRVLLIESINGDFEEFEIELAEDDVIVIESDSEDIHDSGHEMSGGLSSKKGGHGKEPKEKVPRDEAIVIGSASEEIIDLGKKGYNRKGTKINTNPREAVLSKIGASKIHDKLGDSVVSF